MLNEPNDFSELSAECGECRDAQVAPEEVFREERAEDSHLESAYEERTELHDDL